jgi:hypothetical protein
VTTIVTTPRRFYCGRCTSGVLLEDDDLPVPHPRLPFEIVDESLHVFFCLQLVTAELLVDCEELGFSFSFSLVLLLRGLIQFLQVLRPVVPDAGPLAVEGTEIFHTAELVELHCPVGNDAVETQLLLPGLQLIEELIVLAFHLCFQLLLKEGKIPSHKVGSHYRVYRRDVLTYKSKRREEAEGSMQELTRLSQELGLYD